MSGEQIMVRRSRQRRRNVEQPDEPQSSVGGEHSRQKSAETDDKLNEIEKILAAWAVMRTTCVEI